MSIKLVGKKNSHCICRDKKWLQWMLETTAEHSKKEATYFFQISS